MPEGTQQYFTQTRARSSISLTTLNNSGSASYDNTTGELNIPNYTFDGISPMTATGDIIFRNSSGNAAALAAGTNGQVLTLTSGIPAWASYAGWKIDGNTGLNPADNNFIGTTDNVPFKIKVENVNSGIITTQTQGKLNTSFGLGTPIFSNTAAEKNSAFGAGALFSITTGKDNTAVGQGSLSLNMTGENNTAIGQSALANTTGSSNTAVGQASMQTNTIGINNSSLGKDALYTNLSGNSNTGIGHFSLRLSTGNNNSAVGQASLASLTSGDNNSAFGQNSFGSLTSGSNNTSLGYQSGKYFNGNSLNNLLSSSNSIFIGTNAGPSIDNASNQIVIGHNAIGAGNNSVQLGNTSTTKVNTSGSVNATKFVGKAGVGTIGLTASDGSITSVSVDGNDAAGVITINTTGAIGTGDFLTVTFVSPYESVPVVLIHPILDASPSPSNLETKIYCMPSKTFAGSFTLSASGALTPSAKYVIAYHVIGR